MAKNPSVLKSIQKMSEGKALLIAGTLAIIGTVIVLLVHAGSGDGTITIPLNATVRTGTFEKFVTAEQPNRDYDICFSLQRVQSTSVSNPTVRIQASSGQNFTKTEATLDQTYDQPKDLCLTKGFTVTGGRVTLGATLLDGTTVSVLNYCMGVSGQMAGGCEDLNWTLQSGKGTRGYATYPTGSFQSGDTVRVCFDVTPTQTVPGNNGNGVQISLRAGTKAKPDTAALSGGSIWLTAEKTVCLTPLVTTNSSNQIEYSASVTAGEAVLNSMSLDKFDVTPPTAPTKLRAINESRMAIQLRWVASYDPNNGPVKDYIVFRNGKSLGIVQNITFTSPNGIPTLTWTDRKLHPGTLYKYQVQAIDAVGNKSPLSAAISVKTKP